MLHHLENGQLRTKGWRHQREHVKNLLYSRRLLMMVVVNSSSFSSSDAAVI